MITSGRVVTASLSDCSRHGAVLGVRVHRSAGARVQRSAGGNRLPRSLAARGVVMNPFIWPATVIVAAAILAAGAVLDCPRAGGLP